MSFLVLIGVESNEAEKIRTRVDDHVLVYPSPPDTYSFDGKLFTESRNVMGKFLEPRGVVYYGYFDGPEIDRARRAIALSRIPSFPDVRKTILLDDRALATILVEDNDWANPLPRGYVPPGLIPGFEGERVAKWGNRHAGEGKLRFKEFETLPETSIVEPFVRGRSERILIVGARAWHLRYDSADWRKNVQSTVTILDANVQDTVLRGDSDPFVYSLYKRSRCLADKLRLPIAGVDFLIDPIENQAHILEINAYPGFEDVPEAADAFVEETVAWWERAKS